MINLPVGLLCIGLVYTMLHRFETNKRQQPVDWFALFLLAVGVASLQIMLDKGNQLDWFGSGWITLLAVTSFLALSVFAIWTWTSKYPLVNLRLFTRRNFLVGSSVLMLASVAFFGANVVIPLWLQTHMNYSAEWAGRTMAFGGLLAVFMGPLIGLYINRIDARLVTSFGLAMYALFAILSAQLPENVDFWTLALTRLIMGVGMACIFLPLTVIYLSGLSAEQTAGATGLGNFMRNIGSSFGTSIMVTLWDHRIFASTQALSADVVASNPAAAEYVQRLQEMGMTHTQALGYMQNSLISAEASLLATNWLMELSALMMLLLFVMVWFAKPPFVAHRG